jgi:hypothetical protein
MGGLNTVTRLQQFLQSINLYGNGCETRITAFFSPGSHIVAERDVEEIDKAAVEVSYAIDV